MYNREALNLSDSSPPPPPSTTHHHPSIKRERDPYNDFSIDRDRDYSYPPEKKRPLSTPHRMHHEQSLHLDRSLEDRSESPIHENGTDLTKSMKNINNNNNNNNGNKGGVKNGLVSSEQSAIGPAILNGMQFKIISRGKSINFILGEI